MGLYSVRCDTKGCNYNTDILGSYEKLKQHLNEKCPNCNKKKLYNSIDKMNFKLIGDCWYSDGYSKVS